MLCKIFILYLLPGINPGVVACSLLPEEVVISEARATLFLTPNRKGEQKFLTLVFLTKNL